MTVRVGLQRAGIAAGIAMALVGVGPGAGAATAKVPTKVVVDGSRVPTEWAPVPADGDQDRERIVRMQETLREILRNPTLRRLRVGMRVMDAGSGRLYFDKHPATLMDPASNQKVLATATAFMRLGPEWRFRTDLMGPLPDANGVIHGDVVLRGSGDPTVRGADLDRMAVNLAQRGVTRIEGAVLADSRRLGSDDPAEPEPQPDVAGADPEGPHAAAGDSFASKVSPRASLVVNHGMLTIRVRPGVHAGSPAEITIVPADDTFVVRNAARTKPSGRSKVTVRVGLTADAKMQVEVAGKMAAGQRGLVFRRRASHQALYSAVLMRTALVQAGIAVRDRPRLATPRADLALLESHGSAPLGTLLRRINKDSDNDHAERVLEAAGAEVYGGAPTEEKGVRLLREVISELGLSPASYIPKNGSGLGHANRITPEAMAQLLRTLYLDPRIGPEILQSLSVGGVDGTTRNRFRGTLAAHRVRAKTGTLNGKSCLSGLVGDGSDVLVFSIFVDGLRGRRLAAVRGAQVGCVNAMMRYVREGTGERIDLPPGFDQAQPIPDFESGEELKGTEGEADEPAAPTTDDPIDATIRREREERAKADAEAEQLSGP